MEEIWKDVKGFEGHYQVSNLGQVKSIPKFRKNGKGGGFIQKGRIIKTRMDRDGYHELGLHKENKTYFRKLHRLVANEFIDNPLNLPEVNHIDLNKSNNNYSNLEWIDHLNNVRHYFKSLQNM